MTWTRYKGGRGWRVLEDGRIAAQAPSDIKPVQSTHETGIGWIYRTSGEPHSMRQLWADYGFTIAGACEQFDLRPHWVMGLIAIEAGRMKNDRRRFDPRSVREEPGYESDRHTPHRVSPGLMQTLLSTAQQMLPSVPQLAHEETLVREDLFVPQYSILLGCAYIRHQMNRVEDDEADAPKDDPVLNMVAAYNAGSVRETAKNDWHLVTYGEGRIDKFIAFSNDALTVIK